MGNWLSDYVLPAVGGAAGYYFGGPTGAAIGAGGGRAAGGFLKKEDTDANLRNSMAAAMIGYGGGKAVDYGADQWGGDSSMFGSGNTGVGGYSSTPQTGTSGGGFGGGSSGIGTNLPTTMGINALAQMYGASSAKSNANDYYNQSLQNWNSTAFPRAASVDAQSASAVSGINQQSMIAKQRLMDSMASRGMGANSGIIAGASAEEDRARRQRLAQLANNMIQFRNTPMYAPPQLQYTQSAGEGIANNVGGVAGLYAGMGLYNQMR